MFVGAFKIITSTLSKVWLSFIDYMRRKTEFSSKEVTNSMSELRDVFERSCTHLAKVKGDPECQVSLLVVKAIFRHYFQLVFFHLVADKQLMR